MKERNAVLIITLILIILGITTFYFSIIYSEFNFYKSERSITEKTIKETLHYRPNKPYHTLFRNFYSTIFLNNSQAYIPTNSIGIISVSCQKGQAYINIDNLCYNFPEIIQSKCLPYTEPNEYGCTFGNTLGFQKVENYQIESEYELYPENLFKINNRYYIKFIVYSAGNHKFLTTGKNFIIPNNVISQKYYFPKDDVIIYIPYDKTEGFKIIEQEDFLFDTNYSIKLLILLLTLIPALSFFIIWYLLGKELTDPDLPEELSMAPNKRKAWEVAAFFNPPFAGVDKNFFASLILDFYRRKIIDLKIIEEKTLFGKTKDMYLKINNTPKDLDEIEKKFIKLLKEAEKSTDKENKKEGYFNLDKTMKSRSVQLDIKDTYKELDSKIKKEGKNYMKKTGESIFLVIMVLAILVSWLLQSGFIIAVYFISFFFLGVILKYSTILIRYKEDYYKEYKHWQAFKKYLSHSYTIKSATHKTIVMWEEYLLYATALGIPDKVLKEGEKIKIKDERHFAIYTGVYHSSSFVSGGYAAATGHGGGTGGFGGAGGGGVGGGGGGGR